MDDISSTRSVSEHAVSQGHCRPYAPPFTDTGKSCSMARYFVYSHPRNLYSVDV